MGKKDMKSLLLCVSATMMMAFVMVAPISAQDSSKDSSLGSGLPTNDSGILITAAIFVDNDSSLGSGLPTNCDTAAYMQIGGEEIQLSKTYSVTSSGDVECGVCVTDGGWLTLISPTIRKTGTRNDGYFDGSGVEASGGSVVNILNGEIYTDEIGANALWATNEGSSIFMKGGSITTLQAVAHGIDTTNRGSVTLYDVKIDTSGSIGAGAIVNDSGDGTVYATRVTAKTKGPGSPGIYGIGTQSMFTVTDSTLEAETSECVVVLNGSNAAVISSHLVGSRAGVKLGSGGIFKITGGSLTATAGDAFYVGGGEGGAPGGATSSNAPGGAPGGPFFAAPSGDSAITVKGGVKISTSTGNIVNVLESCKATFTVDGTDLNGNLIVAEKGILKVILSNSTLTGTVKGAAMTIDSTSKWNVTGDSVLTSLSDSGGISDNTITNIYGNGHTVYYDKVLAENKDLKGKTYTLANGGKLTPKK